MLHILKGKGQGKDANTNNKKTGMIILISDNADLKMKGIAEIDIVHNDKETLPIKRT